MPHLILFDNETRDHLLPLTFLRPVGALRVGILTIAEKWERILHYPVSYLTQDYLSEKYELAFGDDNYLVNGSLAANGADGTAHPSTRLQRGHPSERRTAGRTPDG
ncbi:MAG: putative sugar nucleotidyl transferase [Rhodococcus sp. (in: high G+C Gram-positive bacteria)]|uniref:putative sugar nucleotidyl transferase n=1 Tax=Rhodococcus sp. TaxID=1831 RepID=UPI002ADA25A7|nr:putative sugar nucleotidyl transferase [Rhodococcus sp. (in: high G+C Gram-positive bacteria)]